MKTVPVRQNFFEQRSLCWKMLKSKSLCSFPQAAESWTLFTLHDLRVCSSVLVTAVCVYFQDGTEGSQRGSQMSR